MTVETETYAEDKLLIRLSGSKGNSFSANLINEFALELDNVVDDPSIKGIIITGEGNMFSVGGNVFAMHEALQTEGAHIYLDDLLNALEGLIIKMVSYPKPIVGAINGAAAGGGLSVALACDDLVAVENAKLGMAFGGLALSPDSGSSVLFAEHFGRKEAIDGIATAKVYTTEYAQSKNILEIVDRDDLLDSAAKVIDNKTSVSPYSYGKTKLLVNQSLLQRLQHNLPIENETIRVAATRDEFKEKVNETIAKLTK